jgi:hypothetical protein
VTQDFTAADPGPGLTAFVVVGFLCLATALLLWSMIRQMRKVPKDLDVPLHPRAELPHLVDPTTGAGHDTRAPHDPPPGPDRGSDAPAAPDRPPAPRTSADDE